VLPEIAVPATLAGGVEPLGGVPIPDIGPEEFADEAEPEAPAVGPALEEVGAAPTEFEEVGAAPTEFKEPEEDRPDGVEPTVPGALGST
jgi:hypothetical protein